MMYHYAITRTIDDDETHSAYFSVANYDPVNCAHMLATGFNTMEANMFPGWALGVVNVEAGTVQYHGKIEAIKRNEPEPSAFAHAARDVLEDAYDEYLLVRAMLYEMGIETIPISAGVDELRERVGELQAVEEALADAEVETVTAAEGVRTLLHRLKHERYARQHMGRKYAKQNEAARAELIEHVKAAYAQWGQVDPGRQREGVKSRLRGMIEVLSKYLVAIGEADADERHAVALRVCDIPEGNYLYGDD